MKLTETVEITGHLMDTGVLARVLDDVLEYGGDYKVDRLDLGREHDDESYARIAIGADDADTLQRILNRVQIHGVNPVNAVDADLQPAPADGVFPDEFYSTTNLDTQVRLHGRWHPVDRAEMDCGLVVRAGRVHNVPVADVRAGDLVVCGATGSAGHPAPAGRAGGRAELRVHGLDGVEREAAGAAGAAHRRADPGGQGRR